jgi:xylulokinase
MRWIVRIGRSADPTAVMFLGIDLGTSELKALLVDHDGKVVGSAARSLNVERPQPRWSEQDPQMWWQATIAAVGDLRRDFPAALTAVRAIGLSGQMHGATLLDRDDRVLRPAILWNDMRADAECAELTRLAPALQTITGNVAMPGFTAPKLLWVAHHEPSLFSRISMVLLPKDYLRLCLTGEKRSDVSDSSGTLWLDVAARRWSEELLTLTNLSATQMPALGEGNEPAGYLRREIADEWGIRHPVVVAGGGGDNAASAVGVGAISDGEGLISLGTSGVIFIARDRFLPNTQSGVHAFCHALPNRWHQMSVMLSAASCLRWVTRLCGAASEMELLREIAAAGPGVVQAAPIFLPYLSGERTPHNDPYAQGVFFGMTHDTDRASVGYAVLEGVAFGLAEGLAALMTSGTTPTSLSLVGGGSRSAYWAQLIANTLNVCVVTHSSGEGGAVTGAARLAMMAAGISERDACQRPQVLQEYRPQPAKVVVTNERLARFRSIYPRVRSIFRNA